jgi:hypothetical protein
VEGPGKSARVLHLPPPPLALGNALVANPEGINEMSRQATPAGEEGQAMIGDDANVIPFKRRREPPDEPLSLRDAILYNIFVFADGAKPPASEYERGWLEALICTLVEAGMPFESWKDELRPETLAVLKALRIDLHPEED